MFSFLWVATKGNRLNPWRSRFLLWRMETYWGWHADQITPRQFRSFLWEHRTELWRFLRWASRMQTQA